ncbi:SPOR domain-containing protein [Novosphingobium sp. PhB165]|uniref:SPOR domain-containing protein n=1 Tax=Novosphingobium sp. PhB165 TaxID=2485105 RepID=UPI0010524B24|nr:SPOR domain-containing protein [Novosphingobium sp. PhB165]
MQKILRFLAANGARSGACCLIGVLAATTAHADVKSGVDAWSSGQYDIAVQQWRPLADKGDADAEFNLAQAYKMGRGVPLDLEQAETLYGKAAAQGHVQAADNYGLLLFQRGQREEAMPYIAAAAARGDSRAQYILGVAHFNGDFVEKDWVAAYALVSLAQQAGLPQAARALAQMDEHIPLAQRQESVALASKMAAESEAARARLDAAASLNIPATRPQTVAPVREAALSGGTATAGADYTRPAPAPVSKPVAIPNAAPVALALPSASEKLPTPEKPVAPKEISQKTVTSPTTQHAPAQHGGWRLQLGAFGVAGNADKLWDSLSKRPEFAGIRRDMVKGGSLTFLYATGFANKGEADKACTALRSSGHECIVSPPK